MKITAGERSGSAHKRGRNRALLAFAVMAALLSSGCQQVAQGVARSLMRGMARSMARGVAKGMARGVARGMARGVVRGVAGGVARGAVRGVAGGMARGVVRGVAHATMRGVARRIASHALRRTAGHFARGMVRSLVRDLASYSLDTIIFDEKYASYAEKMQDTHPWITDTTARFKQVAYSHLPPPGSGWRIAVQTRSTLALFKTPMITPHGIQTFIATSTIRRRGHYSTDIKTLRQQRRDDFEGEEKRARYSNMVVRSGSARLDGAGCAFTKMYCTDTGVAGYEGKRFTLYVDELVCVHPHYPKYMVTLTYSERVPPLTFPAKSPLKHMGRSLNFYTGSR